MFKLTKCYYSSFKGCSLHLSCHFQLFTQSKWTQARHGLIDEWPRIVFYNMHQINFIHTLSIFTITPWHRGCFSENLVDFSTSLYSFSLGVMIVIYTPIWILDHEEYTPLHLVQHPTLNSKQFGIKYSWGYSQSTVNVLEVKVSGQFRGQ